MLFGLLPVLRFEPFHETFHLLRLVAGSGQNSIRCRYHNDVFEPTTAVRIFSSERARPLRLL